MAKQKKRPASAATAAAEAAPGRTGRTPLRDYLILNAAVIALCIIQLLLVQLFLRETRGLYFFFGLLAASFALVSLFDFLYDRTASGDDGA